MRTFNVPDTVRYTITPAKKGVNLSVWETSDTSGTRSSIVFKVNQRVSSLEEAQQLLRFYLEEFKAA